MLPSRMGSSGWNQTGERISASGGILPARMRAAAARALMRPCPVN